MNKLIAAAAAALVLAGAAFAGEREGRMKPSERFDAADTNKDGVLTIDEAAAAAEKRARDNFAKIDTDSDGKITKAEARAAMQNRMAARMDRAWQ